MKLEVALLARKLHLSKTELNPRVVRLLEDHLAEEKRILSTPPSEVHELPQRPGAITTGIRWSTSRSQAQGSEGSRQKSTSKGKR